MKLKFLSALALVAANATAATAPSLNGFPFTNESLKYTLNMPGGPKLGEGHLRATKSASGGWNFELTLDAPVPVFEVHDVYTSSASPDYCTAEFTKRFQHGTKKSSEKEVVDRPHGTATRTTVLNGGGKSEFSVPDCAKDALTLLMYTRKEMGQGRV